MYPIRVVVVQFEVLVLEDLVIRMCCDRMMTPQYESRKRNEETILRARDKSGPIGRPSLEEIDIKVIPSRAEGRNE